MRHDESVFGDAGALMTAVARGGPGLVAVGCTGRDGEEPCRPVVWTSEEGVNWTRSAPLAEAGEIFDIVAAGPGLVAVGAVGEEQEADGAVWVSSDGFGWSLITDPSVFGGPGWQQLRGIAVGPTGLVAVGTGVWTSMDGLTWTRIATDDDFLLNDVAASTDGYVAVGDFGEVLSSADGLTWRVFPDEDGTIAGAVLNAVSTGGSGWIAVGESEQGGTVWVSPSSE